MKEVIKSIFAFLISILPEETKTAEAETIAKIEEAINALEEGEEPTKEEAEKVENALNKLAQMGGVVEKLQNKIASMSNKPNSPQPTMEINHALKTQAYEDKFLNVLLNNNLSATERKSALKSLQIENGITGDDVLFPVRIAEGVRSRVMNDTFISKLYHFGQEDFDVPVTLSANSAHQHSKGKTKTDALIELTKKALKSEAVYAKLPIDYTTMRKASASFYAWVIDKLARIVIATIEEAVLVGVEGITSFTAVTSDTEDFSTRIESAEINRDTIVEMVDAVQYRSNDLTLAVSKSTLSALRREIVATGGTPSYISNEDLAQMLGVNEIITPDFISSRKAVVFSPSAYGLVGDTAPEKIEQYDIKVNAQEVELVGIFGGALVEPKSASWCEL